MLLAMSRAWAGVVGRGMKNRLRVLVDRAGGIPADCRKCPVCGGVAVLDDNSPAMKPAYRYSISCKDHDCRMVMGPSVRGVVLMWIKQCWETKAEWVSA